ncbi:MAG: hypothetical protein Q4C49_04325, partial [Bacillota bacterium]|nr:hypothetical protein [Bacillota bacterium]
GAIAPTAMMIQPIHAQEVVGVYNDHDIENLDCELKGSLVYTGGPQEQKVVVKRGNVVLKEGKDYELEGNIATEVGEYTLKIKGINDYMGEKEMKFQIREEKKVEQTDINKCQVQYLNELNYNGKQQKQEIKLTYGNYVLVEGKDYVVEGNVVTESGYYTMKVTAIGQNFKGVKEVPFYVTLGEEPAEKMNISKCDVQLVNKLVDNGKEQVQQVQVKDGNKVLVEGKDYTVSNNVVTEAGTYTLKVKGMGDEYTGEKEIQFTVKEQETNVGMFAALGAGMVALVAGIVVFFKNRKQK